MRSDTDEMVYQWFLSASLEQTVLSPADAGFSVVEGKRIRIVVISLRLCYLEKRWIFNLIAMSLKELFLSSLAELRQGGHETAFGC